MLTALAGLSISVPTPTVEYMDVGWHDASAAVAQSDSTSELMERLIHRHLRHLLRAPSREEFSAALERNFVPIMKLLGAGDTVADADELEDIDARLDRRDAASLRVLDMADFMAKRTGWAEMADALVKARRDLKRVQGLVRRLLPFSPNEQESRLIRQAWANTRVMEIAFHCLSAHVMKDAPRATPAAQEALVDIVSNATRDALRCMQVLSIERRRAAEAEAGDEQLGDISEHDAALAEWDLQPDGSRHVVEFVDQDAAPS